MGELHVFYNLFADKSRKQFIEYLLPGDWIWKSTGTTCPKSHRFTCNCEFVFYDVYVGSLYNEYIVKEYLFDLYNDMMFEGIVVNFMISKNS